MIYNGYEVLHENLTSGKSQIVQLSKFNSPVLSAKLEKIIQQSRKKSIKDRKSA